MPRRADGAVRGPRGSYPNAEAAGREVLSLPMYPELTPHLIKEIVSAAVLSSTAASAT
jgi:dTDP-4-amino-4,6-dideoxygalactose transaminase